MRSGFAAIGCINVGLIPSATNPDLGACVRTVRAATTGLCVFKAPIKARGTIVKAGLKRYVSGKSYSQSSVVSSFRYTVDLRLAR